MNAFSRRHGRAEAIGTKKQGNSQQYRTLQKQGVTRQITATEASMAFKAVEENVIPLAIAPPVDCQMYGIIDVLKGR
jgi:hypothetical protein